MLFLFHSSLMATALTTLLFGCLSDAAIPNGTLPHYFAWMKCALISANRHTKRLESEQVNVIHMSSTRLQVNRITWLHSTLFSKKFALSPPPFLMSSFFIAFLISDIYMIARTRHSTSSMHKESPRESPRQGGYLEIVLIGLQRLS